MYADSAFMRRQNKGYILVVEDDLGMSEALQEYLIGEGYGVKSTESGSVALTMVEEETPDLVISDVHLKDGMTGYQVCERIRSRFINDYVPVILITGSMGQRISGLKAGADDFLSKPFNLEELRIRIQALIRIREHMTRLRRFFSPQIADLIVSEEDDNPFHSHRRDVTVIFIDLRGFTSFSERAEPDEVMRVLSEYYSEVGRLGIEHKGTLGHIAGDGMMIFFNDPVPIENHELQALRMIVEVRKQLNNLEKNWNERGHDLSYGIGVATGPATVGGVGFREFWEYSVIGTVPNLASRLCDQAAPRQVLVCEPFANAIASVMKTIPSHQVELKGISACVRIFKLVD